MSVIRWRTFLEPARNDVDSYVAVSVDDNFIDLKVADCDRRVHLYFYPGTAKERRTARAKLARLREALDRVEQAIDIFGNAREDPDGTRPIREVWQ